MLDVWLDSVGLVGPGLVDWPGLVAILRGEAPLDAQPTRVTLPPILPPAERRRTGVAVKVAIAAGHQAGARSSFDLASLASVFSSSGGDGDNCHAICDALASSDRMISPTRFHNSVHNAPSGYWSIATTATAASTSLCAYDASFCAGLLEAATQAIDEDRPVILVAYDAPYPEPLKQVRPIPDAFGLALVLAPHATPASVARLSISLTGDAFDRMQQPALESMRVAIPTARALPLLAALSQCEPRRVVLEYLDGSDAGPDGDPGDISPVRVAVLVAPCAQESS